MYTEDDEKVDVKEDNSNIKYSDFYTSFNEIDNEEKKPKKGKKKSSSKPENNAVKVEEDYQDFYGNNVDESLNDENKSKKNTIRLIIAGALFIILIVLLVILFGMKGNSVKGDIELAKTSITLDIGGKDYISYRVINTGSTVTSKFESSDERIVVVSDNGEITAISVGEAIVTVHYTIDGVTREKRCNIKVNDNANVKQDLTLNLNLSNGKDNVWTNKDVTITPDASSIFGITSIKYAINCSDNCEYKDISDNKITISSSGVTKVRIIARDKKNQEATKEVTIKIDKEAPKVTLNSDTNIKSNKDVEVCVTCTDNLSGCKQSKVCRKYNASKSNQTIAVEDVAGNKSNSKSFNVTITRTTPPCTLRVSSDGTVTATLREQATYYGFNSSYTGNNEVSKKITLGDNHAKVVYYYVKNSNGATGKCFLTVVKKCACPNNSTDPNCKVSCTFTSQ